jgi:hypothetical protein
VLACAHAELITTLEARYCIDSSFLRIQKDRQESMDFMRSLPRKLRTASLCAGICFRSGLFAALRSVVGRYHREPKRPVHLMQIGGLHRNCWSVCQGTYLDGYFLSNLLCLLTCIAPRYGNVPTQYVRCYGSGSSNVRTCPDVNQPSKPRAPCSLASASRKAQHEASRKDSARYNKA